MCYQLSCYCQWRAVCQFCTQGADVGTSRSFFLLTCDQLFYLQDDWADDLKDVLLMSDQLMFLQDNWFDDLGESADDSDGRPIAAPQTWKVHQGLAADDSQFGTTSHGIMNAAFGVESDVPKRPYSSKDIEADIPDEF